MEDIKDILGAFGFTRKESYNVCGISDEEQEMINICKEWIRKFTDKRKTINCKYGSYGLKHEAERWANDYIHNGAFILAAIEEGYDYERHGPNACFNMSFKKFKNLWQKCPECGYNFGYIWKKGDATGICPRCYAKLRWKTKGTIETVMTFQERLRCKDEW